jgi:hypothetical protein
MCERANIDAQWTGKLKEPRVTSETSRFPSLCAFSAPTTSAESHRPDAMREYAVAIAFVPELQRLSTLCDILGFIPSISEIIVEPYCSVAHVEKSTASTPLSPWLFKTSMQGSQAMSKIDLSVAFVNFEVAATEIATLRTLKG